MQVSVNVPVNSIPTEMIKMTPSSFKLGDSNLPKIVDVKSKGIRQNICRLDKSPSQMYHIHQR